VVEVAEDVDDEERIALPELGYAASSWRDSSLGRC